MAVGTMFLVGRALSVPDGHELRCAEDTLEAAYQSLECLIDGRKREFILDLLCFPLVFQRVWPWQPGNLFLN